jgi:deoxyribonuclease-4
MQVKLGAHQSIVEGYDKALERISNIKGGCLQIFSTSPRSWTFKKLSNSEINNFILKKNNLKINPVYFHASYLINLAGSKRVVELSQKFLINELNIASKLTIKGSIVHLGSYKENPNFRYLIKNISDVLLKTHVDTLFIIENSGTKKIGHNLKEIGNIVKTINDKRLKICLDTCHLHAAGYDLSSQKKLNNFLEFFDDIIGLHKLELFHINDSRDKFESSRDRHENILKGNVGKETFKAILNNKITAKYPFIIETPGFDNKGPDKKNLDILKSLLN